MENIGSWKILIDSYKNYEKHPVEEQPVYAVITFDLKNGTSLAYKAIDDTLTKALFTRFIQAKVKIGLKDTYQIVDLPKNTYVRDVSEAMTARKIGSLNRVRDEVTKSLRDMLGELRRRGECEGFSYLVFISERWTWAAGN